MDYYKYPRTFHLPMSPGRTDDDKVMMDMSSLMGEEVVITEKMDGENTTIYSDGYIHARSIDGRNHPSMNWVKNWSSFIVHNIPEGIRVCGENLFAKHSILYRELPSYFLGFSVWHEDRCFSWNETEDFFDERFISKVPLIYRGKLTESVINDIIVSLDTEKQEGFVVRLAREFYMGGFDRCVAKWVRPKHVTSSKHWKHEKLEKNSICPIYSVTKIADVTL